MKAYSAKLAGDNSRGSGQMHHMQTALFLHKMALGLEYLVSAVCDDERYVRSADQTSSDGILDRHV